MSSQIQVHDLDDGLHCPQCDVRIESHAFMSSSGDGKLHKGHIMVCGNCAAVLKLGDSDFEKMTKKEIKDLDHTSRGVLKMAVAAVIAQNLRNGGRG